MSTFRYAWKSSDGARHGGIVDAASREDAFRRLREQGIKPISVEANNWWSTKDDAGFKKPIVRLAACVLGGVLVAATVLAFALGRCTNEFDEERILSTAQGKVVLRKARPLVRQEIFGDRARIENFPTNLFKYAAERTLAAFAEPGRPCRTGLAPLDEADVRACLGEPIYVSSLDFTEYVDLKRIVTGLKDELRVYLNGGGTLEGYRRALVGRQNEEAAIRARAEAQLAERLKNQAPDRAYDFWLRKNASLKSMGIYALPLPDVLSPNAEIEE